MYIASSLLCAHSNKILNLICNNLTFTKINIIIAIVPAIGLILSAILVLHYLWQTLFYVLAVFGLVILASILLCIQQARSSSLEGRVFNIMGCVSRKSNQIH